MDYDELKKKYGSSSEGKQSGKDILPKFAITLIVLVIIAPIIYLSYKSFIQSESSGAEDFLNEFSSIELAVDTKSLIEFGQCDRVRKYDTEWVINGCEGGSTVHMVFTDDEHYSMKVCGGWTDGKDLLTRSPKVLEAFGFPTQCDSSSVFLVGAEDGTQIYNVCGTKIYMSEGCLV